MQNLPTDKIISCFYDSSVDCVKVIDPQGILLSFNPHGLEVMEIDDAKDVLGKDWISFWQGNMATKAAAALADAAAGKYAQFEGYCPTFKGNVKYWEVTLAPLHNDFGDVQWILVTSRDMSKYRALQDKVTELQQEIRALRKAQHPEPVM